MVVAEMRIYLLVAEMELTYYVGLGGPLAQRNQTFHRRSNLRAVTNASDSSKLNFYNMWNKIICDFCIFRVDQNKILSVKLK